jgi:hypothetical protein
MPNNTCGYDKIATNLLKIRSVNISIFFNHVCVTSLLRGIFSVCLEYCVVKPLHKKGGEIAFLTTDL